MAERQTSDTTKRLGRLQSSLRNADRSQRALAAPDPTRQAPSDIVPYVDFAIWGPHGGRLMRKLKLHGNTFSSDGSLIPMEVSGPLSLCVLSAMARRKNKEAWQSIGF